MADEDVDVEAPQGAQEIAAAVIDLLEVAAGKLVAATPRFPEDDITLDLIAQAVKWQKQRGL